MIDYSALAKVIINMPKKNLLFIMPEEMGYIMSSNLDKHSKRKLIEGIIKQRKELRIQYLDEKTGDIDDKR